MTFVLKTSEWEAIFPKAPQSVIEAFATQPQVLEDAGITQTRTRLAYALANVEHECGGFSIKNLTESIKYSAERMAEVWPKRFKSAADVKSKYGTGSGWRKRAFDDIYGNRMGNRPGTSDGSTYIGRGGPQATGRDGYKQVGRRAGLDLVRFPDMATEPKHQPAILAAYWEWKGMARFADKGDFRGCVKAWNGGYNGYNDRIDMLKGNDPIIARLSKAVRLFPMLEDWFK